MSFQLERYSPANKSEWNSFLGDCKNQHFIFNRDFMEYHSDRFIDHSLIIRDKKNKIIGLFPANIINNVVHSHQGLTFGGFLINSKMTTQFMLDIFALVIEYFKSIQVHKIVYKCLPYIYTYLPSQEELYALFRFNAVLIRRDVSTAIDLDNIISYSKGRKWGINRAKKFDVKVERTVNPSTVWPLIRQILSEKYQSEPVHTENEIDFLQEKFPNNIFAYTASISSNVVACIVTFDTDIVSHAQYLAVNNEGRDCAALDYLIDQVIQEKKNNKKYFDFGISNEDSGLYLNEGLISQKEGFGARAVVHDFYEIEINK